MSATKITQVAGRIFQFYYHFLHTFCSTYFGKISAFYIQKNADVIIWNCHIIECSLSFDWLKIFYKVCLKLILLYSSMLKCLVDSSTIVLVNFWQYSGKIASVNLWQSPPIWYLEEKSNVILLAVYHFHQWLGLYCNIGNNSCRSFRTRCCMYLVWLILS